MIFEYSYIPYIMLLNISVLLFTSVVAFLCDWAFPLLLNRKKRWDFYCDMEYYEGCKYYCEPIPDNFKDFGFYICVWIFHKLYGQWQYPAPSKQAK